MRRAVAVVLLLTLAACGGGDGDPKADPSTPSGTPTPSPSPSTSSPSAPVTSYVVGGHTLWGQCTPGKAPYVVYVHGLGGSAQDFLGAATTVTGERPEQGFCGYDRVNSGSSESVDGTRPVGASADELEGFLEAAGVDGPVLLVAASYGGLVVSRFAEDHPEQVAGLVLADATLPFETQLFTPEVRHTIEGLAANNAEHVDLLQSYEDAAGTLPDVPVTYVDGRLQDLATDWGAVGYRAALKRFIDGLPQGRIVETEADHFGVVDTPELAAAIVQMIDGQ